MKRRISFTTALVLAILLIFGSTWTAFANTQGAIHTIDEDGNILNHFVNKSDVYFKVVSEEFTEGEYYVRVTNSNGKNVLGVTDEPKEIVKGENYNLFQLTEFEDESKNGVYKVWISTESSFPKNKSKTDNFKVMGEGEEEDKGTIVINKTLETEGGEPHVGITFGLNNENDYNAVAKTDENGQIVFYGLTPGDYTLEEDVLEGFTTSLDEGGKEIQVKADEIVEINVVNKKIEEEVVLGSLIVKYLDEEGNELADSKFEEELALDTYEENAIDIEGYILKNDKTQSVTLTEEDHDQEIIFIYEKIEDIEDPEEPLSPADPKDPEDPKEDPEDEDEIIEIEDEETPLGGAKLPQTGGTPDTLFYGAGIALTLLGSIIRKKR
jgi:LPXTG-motif cell wall-anchored protein